MNVILEGQFEVPQERQTVSLTEKTKRLATDALREVLIAAELTTKETFANAHLLAHVAPIGSTFPVSLYDRQWWSTELASVAKQLASMPLVETPADLHAPEAPKFIPVWQQLFQALRSTQAFPNRDFFSSDSGDETNDRKVLAISC